MNLKILDYILISFFSIELILFLIVLVGFFYIAFSNKNNFEVMSILIKVADIAFYVFIPIIILIIINNLIK